MPKSLPMPGYASRMPMRQAGPMPVASGAGHTMAAAGKALGGVGDDVLRLENMIRKRQLANEIREADKNWKQKSYDLKLAEEKRVQSEYETKTMGPVLDKIMSMDSLPARADTKPLQGPLGPVQGPRRAPVLEPVQGPRQAPVLGPLGPVQGPLNILDSEIPAQPAIQRPIQASAEQPVIQRPIPASDEQVIHPKPTPPPPIDPGAVTEQEQQQWPSAINYFKNKGVVVPDHWEGPLTPEIKRELEYAIASYEGMKKGKAGKAATKFTIKTDQDGYLIRLPHTGGGNAEHILTPDGEKVKQGYSPKTLIDDKGQPYIISPSGILIKMTTAQKKSDEIGEGLEADDSTEQTFVVQDTRKKDVQIEKLEEDIRTSKTKESRDAATHAYWVDKTEQEVNASRFEYKNKIKSVNKIISLAKSIIQHPGLNSVSGLLYEKGLLTKEGKAANTIITQYIELKALKTIGELEVPLTPVSDADLDVVRKAATILSNRRLTPKQKKDALRKAIKESITYRNDLERYTTDYIKYTPKEIQPSQGAADTKDFKGVITAPDPKGLGL